MRLDRREDLVAVQLTVLPPVEELQTDPQTRAKWIDYSAYDAKATWQLAKALKKQLEVSTATQYIYFGLLKACPECTGQ